MFNAHHGIWYYLANIFEINTEDSFSIRKYWGPGRLQGLVDEMLIWSCRMSNRLSTTPESRCQWRNCVSHNELKVALYTKKVPQCSASTKSLSLQPATSWQSSPLSPEPWTLNPEPCHRSSNPLVWACGGRFCYWGVITCSIIETGSNVIHVSEWIDTLIVVKVFVAGRRNGSNGIELLTNSIDDYACH